MMNVYSNQQQYEDVNLNFNAQNNAEQGFGIPTTTTKFGASGKTKGKKKKGIKRLEQITAQDENFNIYGLGEIKYAELHGKANRPLRQVKDELDLSIQKCPCCNLPAPDEKGEFLKFYSTCDNPDDFSNCGQGVVLYYSFIKYIIVNLFIVAVCISCFNIYFSYKYYTELEKVCNNFYKATYAQDTKFKEICKFYFTEVEDENFEYYSLVDSFFFRFSSINIKDYRNLYEYLNPGNSGPFNSTVINISRINFCCLIFIFILNLIYILFLYNKSNGADYLVFTVSDYSIFLTNLYDVHGKFLNILKEIENNKKTYQEKGKNFIPELHYKKIGGVPQEGMSELDIFQIFLKNKIITGKFSEKFTINRIDFCYKLEEITRFQKIYEKRLALISEIEFDPKVKKENKNENLEGDDRKITTYPKFRLKKEKNILEGTEKCVFYFLCCKKERTLDRIKKEKDFIEKKINEITEDAKKNTSNYFGGAAFITFETIKEQELYLKNLPNNAIDYFIEFLRNIGYIFCSCCINKSSENIYYLKRNIKFEAAPEPEDIIFENLETKPFAKIMRTILVYIISIIICGVSFGIIVALNELQVYVDSRDSSGHVILLYIISLAITGVTSGIDIFLEIVLKSLTQIEKQSTKTDFSLSYSIKLTLFTFLNGALLPLFSEVFINKSDGYEILISNMLMKFLVNAFVSPLLWTLNFGYFFKKFQICLIERKIENEKDKSEEEKTFDKNQKELNELYELPPMNVELKYSYIFKTLLMSFLYIPIFPLGIIISLLGLLLGYWLEKFNFANMYKRPEMLNRQIAENYVSYFVLILFAYGVGDYIFLNDVFDTKVWSLLNIIIFGVLIIIPYHQLLSRDILEVDESALNNQKYDDAYPSFFIDYERANPMTQKDGNLKYQKTLKDLGYIKNDEYEKNISYINSANPMELYVKKRRNHFRGGYSGGYSNQNYYNNQFFPPMNQFPPHGPPVNFNYPPPNINIDPTIAQNNSNGYGSNMANNPNMINQNNAYTSQIEGQYPINNQYNIQVIQPPNPSNNNYIPSQGYSGGNMGMFNNNQFANNNVYSPNNYQNNDQGYSAHKFQ